MGNERIVFSTPEQATAGVFYEDGTINEEYVAQNFGLGIEEASQEIQYGKYTGTVAKMLADEDCPVGHMVKEAYAEKGIEGTEEKLNLLAAMDSRAVVKFTQKTIERERLKKK